SPDRRQRIHCQRGKHNVMSEQPSFKPPPFFRPVEVDLFNPKASFLQSVKEGNRYFVRFEITRELWELFEEPDPSLRLRGPLYRVYDDERDKTPEQVEAKPEKPKREKKPPKPGTDENGHYWNRMEKGNYFAVPGVAEVLGCQPIKAEVNEAI